MDQDYPSRPAKVGTAVKLLYLTMGLGLLRSLLEASRWGELGQQSPIVSPLFIAVVSLGVLLFMWFFIYKIGKGRNWARVTFLVLLIIGIPLSALPLYQSLAANPVSGLLGVAQVVLQIVAMVLLFQQPSSEWFRKMKAAR